MPAVSWTKSSCSRITTRRETQNEDLSEKWQNVAFPREVVPVISGQKSGGGGYNVFPEKYVNAEREVLQKILQINFSK